MANNIEIYCGDSRTVLSKYPDGCFNLIVTSPPYADARKKHYHSIKPDEYSDFLTSFHDEFWRVLADNASFVLNIKDKAINGVRHRYVWHTVDKLSKLGWHCVDDYLWSKPNAMPGFWKNRLRDEWEYCFHMTKNKNFNMYQENVKKAIGDWAKTRLRKLNGKSAERHNSENGSGFGRDLRAWKMKDKVLPGNVLNLPLVGKNMGHPAVFPVGLPEFFIKLFTKEGDTVLDPFAGSGTTGIAANNLNRNAVLIELEADYITTIENRLNEERQVQYTLHPNFSSHIPFRS